MTRKCDNYFCREAEAKRFRCSVIMPEGTPPQDAEFVKDGVAYGYTYYYCAKCLKADTRPLKVWDEGEEA